MSGLLSICLISWFKSFNKVSLNRIHQDQDRLLGHQVQQDIKIYGIWSEEEGVENICDI